MGRDYIRFRSNREREKLLSRAKEAAEVDQDAAIFDIALEHYVESVANAEDLVEREELLTPALAEIVSTSHVSINLYPQVRT